MKKPVLFISLIIVILSIVQIIVSNNLSTKGVLLGKLEDEIKAYKKENYLIREKLLLASSFTNIASKAGSLGFVDDKSQIVLSPSLVLAVKQ